MINDPETYRRNAIDEATTKNTIVQTAAWIEPAIAAFPDGSSWIRRAHRTDENGLALVYRWTVYGGGLAQLHVEAEQRRMKQARESFRNQVEGRLDEAEIGTGRAKA